MAAADAQRPRPSSRQIAVSLLDRNESGIPVIAWENFLDSIPSLGRANPTDGGHSHLASVYENCQHHEGLSTLTESVNLPHHPAGAFFHLHPHLSVCLRLPMTGA